MHIATITRHDKGKTYKSYLLRHSHREGGKVKHQTLANLSKLPEEMILVLRKWLAGSPVPNHDDRFKTIRTTPHGHVAAVLGTLRRIGLDRVTVSYTHLTLPTKA